MLAFCGENLRFRCPTWNSRLATRPSTWRGLGFEWRGVCVAPVRLARFQNSQVKFNCKVSKRYCSCFEIKLEILTVWSNSVLQCKSVNFRLSGQITFLSSTHCSARPNRITNHIINAEYTNRQTVNQYMSISSTATWFLCSKAYVGWPGPFSGWFGSAKCLGHCPVPFIVAALPFPSWPLDVSLDFLPASPCCSSQ